MEDYKKHIEAFESYLILGGYSKATQRSYRKALEQFFRFRISQDIKGPFNQDDARNYILHRYAQGREWQTINCDYSALQHFYRNVLSIGWDVQHIPRPGVEKKLPGILSKQTVKRVIEHGSTFKHQVFMTLLYCTGLRISEALNLRLEDIDGERLQVRVVKGKGSRDRYVRIPVELLDLLRKYYREYRPEKYLFNGQGTRERWSNRTAQYGIKKARESAGVLKRVTAHVFRHCYATHHLEEGTNLVYLKEQMGHRSLRTTCKYIRLCKEYQKRVHHPIVGMEIEYRHKRP